MSRPTPLSEVMQGSGTQFIDEAGWRIALHFGDMVAEYQAARSGAAVFDLSQRGQIELAGKDAVTFLHNLCTNDIKRLADGEGCEAFLCTLKAKIVAHFFVSRRAESLWLDTVTGFSEPLLAALDRFLISEDVCMTDRSGERLQIHVAGPGAAAIVERVTDTPVSGLKEHQSVLSKRAIEIRRHDRLGLPGYDLFATSTSVWSDLVSQGAQPAGSAAREVLRIEGGMPEQGRDFDENTSVMEVGRTAQAISYTKGCFLGQEPIVRTRDLGHVNRTLLRLRIDGTDSVPSGTKLTRDGQEVGQVTSAALSPGTGMIAALGYVRRGHQTPGTRIECGDGRAAEVLSTPSPS
jgi:folate-binding protein YgfZ